MADPAVRIVSLTITEGGYLVNQVTGEFDAEARSIAAGPRARGHARRPRSGSSSPRWPAARAEGTPPFTVLSCDNIPGNGDVARRMMTAFARLLDPDLADWMQAEVAFPNSMVDRITPVTAPEDVERLARGVRRRGRVARGLRAVHPVGRRGRLRPRTTAAGGRRACSWSTTSSRTS